MSNASGNIFARSLARLSRRKKKSIKIPNKGLVESSEPPQAFESHNSSTLFEKMNRLRRSLRLPRRRDRSNDRHLSPQATGGSKQYQWQPDESAVRTGCCSFNVKYLGAVEVFESRGMQVCEGALKSMKASKRKPVKAVLYVSGDGLRVVDQGNSRGLLVDQTIEKVSFCAPDRNNDKGFAYICRDGASRRWMCHGFLATKESGERLSHAVGCAFAICLERKKKRDEENAIGSSNGSASTSSAKVEAALNPNWDEPKTEATTSRSNLAYQSFRKHVPMEARYLDPQSVIVNEAPACSHNDTFKTMAKPRPTSNPALFARQGSLRAPDIPTRSDQFRRNFSLRTNSTFDTSPSKKTFGQSLHNEPIYEGDEDPLGLGISSSATNSASTNPVEKNGLVGLDFGWNSKPAPLPEANSSFVGNQIANFAQWPDSNVSSPLDDIQKQFEQFSMVAKTGNSSMTNSVSRSKADEWLDDVLRVSMTMSPTSNVIGSSGVTPSTSFSGPPPSHAPPPLPVKQAVSNGNPSLYQNTPVSVSPNPSGINWDVAPSLPPVPQKPTDPFDVHWSKSAVSSKSSN
ncbi:unnamed protein product [Caenorhabditis bovis]|uniref:PID domain-containing protein n=1 Tax=Caenorhabditis bovis TaxID=2654633 RepID=A0A8S1EAI7_9PELO|nr:unnamed protein product [Caenorhabditis bovis]